MSERTLRLTGTTGSLGPWGALLEGIRKALRLNGRAAEPIPYQSAVSFMTNMDAIEQALCRGEPVGPHDEQALLTIDRGDADVSANFREQVDWAYRQIGCHARYRHANLRALARVWQPQYVGVAATYESGITSLAQVAREQRPVRLLTVSKSPIPYQTRMMGYVNSRVLQLTGFTQDDVLAWGGKLYGLPEAPLAIQERDVDLIALPAYSGWGPAWGMQWLRAQIRLNLRFLPIPDAVRDAMVQELGLRKGDLPPHLFRGVEQPVPTFRMADQIVTTHAGLDDADAYAVVRAIDEHPECLQEYQVQHAYNPFFAWQDTAIPLHPGAEAYYRERGYLQHVPGGGR